MKINQQRLYLEYTTAPSLREPDSNGIMLPIRLQLLHSGADEESRIFQRFLDGKIRGFCAQEFREQLPALLTGELDSWILWHVRMRPQQLQLLYTRRQPTVQRPSDDAFLSDASMHDNAQLTLNAPKGIVCDFVIPPMLGEPEKCIRYNFGRYLENTANQYETCDLRVTEVVKGQVQFRYRLKTTYLPNT